MTSNLDELIRSTLDDIARDAPELGPPPRPEPMMEAMATPPSSHVRRRVLQVAVLAVLAVGIAAVVAVRLGRDANSPRSDQPAVSATVQSPSTIAGGTSSPETTAPPTSSSTTIDSKQDLDRQLSEIESSLPIPDLDALQAGDWLVATWLPPGYEFAYFQDGGGLRRAAYDDATSGDELLVSVSTLETVGLPDTDGWDLDVDLLASHGSARLQSEGVSIDVNAPTDSDDLIRIIEGLTIEPEASLPTPVLHMDVNGAGSGAPVVAAITFNGSTVDLRAQMSNGYYCLQALGGTCPIHFDPATDVMSDHGGGGAGWTPGGQSMEVHSFGIARADVARIEFALANGETIETFPTDLSGMFDVRFWLFAEEIELAEPLDPSPDASPPEGIVRAVAYGEDGNVLAVVGGPPDPGPEVIDRLAVGNNVMLGAAADLAGRGFVVDAVQHRQFDDIVDVLRGVQPRLGTVVVIDGAVNGPLSPTGIEEAVALLSDVDQVIVVTTSADREYAASNNEMLRALPDQYPNVTVADWATEAGTCLETCLYEDHIHLRPEGQARYAQLIADVVAGARN